MSLVGKIVVEKREKMRVFASLPAQQVLLFAVLDVLQIPTAVYHAHLKPNEKADVHEQFNTDATPMVLIGSYAFTSCGLNFQHKCH
jgi:hypothetical protein